LGKGHVPIRVTVGFTFPQEVIHLVDVLRLYDPTQFNQRRTHRAKSDKTPSRVNPQPLNSGPPLSLHAKV